MIAHGPIVDNVDAGRFELAVDGQIAFVDYELTGHRMILTHTEVPVAARGRGEGSALVRGVLDIARARGSEVVALCPFVAGFIRRHHEYLDLVSAQNRQRLDLE